MSYVIAAPEYVAAAATDLANIGSAIGDANNAAMAPISTVLAPGADEVSAMVTALFDSHAQIYQALSAQVAMFHDQFVQLMSSAGAQYAAAEAANASPLQAAGQGVAGAINAPTQSLAVHPSASTSAAAASAPIANIVTNPSLAASRIATGVSPAAAVPTGGPIVPAGSTLLAGLGAATGNSNTVVSAGAAQVGAGVEEFGAESGALVDSGEATELAAATPMVTQVAAAPAATASLTASVHPIGPSGQAESPAQRQQAASA